jgi:ferredoxin
MSTTYTVEIKHQDQTYSIEVPDDRTILSVAEENNIDLPNSCNSGVCTTCAAKLSEGTVDQTDGMGVGLELQAEGYALLCVAYPRSNIKLEAGKEDEVYHRQFGKPA